MKFSKLNNLGNKRLHKKKNSETLSAIVTENTAPKKLYELNSTKGYIIANVIVFDGDFHGGTLLKNNIEED